jgi:hypothetical protein
MLRARSRLVERVRHRGNRGDSQVSGIGAAGCRRQYSQGLTPYRLLNALLSLNGPASAV